MNPLLGYKNKTRIYLQTEDKFSTCIPWFETKQRANNKQSLPNILSKLTFLYDNKLLNIGLFRNLSK